MGNQTLVTNAFDGQTSIILDKGSNLQIQTLSNGSSSSEEWVLGSQQASITIPGGLTTALYYYDLLSQNIGFLSSSTNFTAPIVSYITSPSGVSSEPNSTVATMMMPYFWQQPIMALKGTNVSVSNYILGTNHDRWATPVDSWNISQANQIYYVLYYYHQYQINASYLTDGSIVTPAPLLSGTQYGSNYQQNLMSIEQAIWLDELTPWSITANITAPSGTERWVSNGTNGNATGFTSIVQPYTHQYYLSVNSPYGSPSGSGWFNAGSTAYATLDYGIIPIDTGARYAFSAWSIGGNNYQQSDAITMNSSIVAIANWNAQYYLTVNSPYRTTSGSGWYNNGSAAQATLVAYSPVSGGPNIQYVFDEWAGDSSGSNLFSDLLR